MEPRFLFVQVSFCRISVITFLALANSPIWNLNHMLFKCSLHRIFHPWVRSFATGSIPALKICQKFIPGMYGCVLNMHLVTDPCVTLSFVQVMLVGPVGKKLRGFLDKNVNVPASSLQEEDEVHLIMEYSRGEKWGENAASCANRFIFSHDVANSELQPLAHFAESLQSFNPDLVVVSGLHLLDNKPASFWQPRVDKLKSSLKRLPANTPVHLELASIANLEFVAGLAKSIFQSVHSIGLNEQELMAVSRAAGGPHTSVSAKGPPQAGVVADVLAWLLTKFGGGQSTLSRVHFHSLTFHVTSQVSLLFLSRLGQMWYTRLLLNKHGIQLTQHANKQSQSTNGQWRQT